MRRFGARRIGVRRVEVRRIRGWEAKFGDVRPSESMLFRREEVMPSNVASPCF